jgi:anthranilate phosphoribosyltransferase
MHGGDRMPTKYGVPLIEIWQALGVDWQILSLDQVHQVLTKTLLGFIYLPQHFPLAHALVPYRDQIGKRPPFATLELIWCPYAGESHIVSGFVHPPTQVMFQQAFKLRGTTRFTTVKGLEGSCDLPRDRTAIIGVNAPEADPPWQHLLLAPRDYGLAGPEVSLQSTEQLVQEMQKVLQGESSSLMQAALWNGGFYLWHCGLCPDLAAGIAAAETLLTQGKVAKKLQEIHEAVASLQFVHQR